MPVNDESVESYLAYGCGRCDKFRTPECKVHSWSAELRELRDLVRATELVETMKWGSPCYTLDGQNVLMITALVDWCGLSFFEGSLLDDPEGRLVPPGPASHAARVMKFTSLAQLRADRERAEAFVAAAIAKAKAGEKVMRERAPLEVPSELQAALDRDARLSAAWEALTPGRRRSHALHVAGAKKAATRERRADKCAPKILAGKGFQER